MSALVPRPDGDLVVRVPCTASPSGVIALDHPVVVHPDWSVSVPAHDLGAERIVRALGGWSSCLHFAESIVPALHHVLEVMGNPTILRRDGEGRWLNTANGGCRAPHRHSRLRDAVRHEVSAEHASTLFASDEWRVDRVPTAALSQFLGAMWVARDMWIGTAAPAEDPSVPLQLWRAGVLPDRVARVTGRLPALAFPLPASYLITSYFNHLELHTHTTTRRSTTQ